jgi:hypothetical protein
MATPRHGKKYFTVAEANGTLPLVRAIVRDITELAKALRSDTNDSTGCARAIASASAPPTTRRSSKDRRSWSAARKRWKNTCAS